MSTPHKVNQAKAILKELSITFYITLLLKKINKNEEKSRTGNLTYQDTTLNFSKLIKMGAGSREKDSVITAFLNKKQEQRLPQKSIN